MTTLVHATKRRLEVTRFRHVRQPGMIGTRARHFDHLQRAIGIKCRAAQHVEVVETLVRRSLAFRRHRLRVDPNAVPATARRADHLVVLKDGVVQEQGSSRLRAIQHGDDAVAPW